MTRSHGSPLAAAAAFAAFLVPPRFAPGPTSGPPLMKLSSAGHVPQAGEHSKARGISPAEKNSLAIMTMKSWTPLLSPAGPKKQPYGVGWVSNGLQLKRTII